MSKTFAPACVALLLVSLLGCGGSDENTVIEPGDDYQLSAQEEANRLAEIEARQGRDSGG